jgi:hypothetical protein
LESPQYTARFLPKPLHTVCGFISTRIRFSSGSQGIAPRPACLPGVNAVELGQATWADLHEATEYGAYGVGIVVALRLTKKSRVERSVRGTGIDYWIGDGASRDGPFQRTARLEISGILNGDEAKIAERLRGKLSQSARSNSSRLPAYIAVIDFARPEARVIQSKAGARP